MWHHIYECLGDRNIKITPGFNNSGLQFYRRLKLLSIVIFKATEDIHYIFSGVEIRVHVRSFHDMNSVIQKPFLGFVYHHLYAWNFFLNLSLLILDLFFGCIAKSNVRLHLKILKFFMKVYISKRVIPKYKLEDMCHTI